MAQVCGGPPKNEDNIAASRLPSELKSPIPMLEMEELRKERTLSGLVQWNSVAADDRSQDARDRVSAATIVPSNCQQVWNAVAIQIDGRRKDLRKRKEFRCGAT